MTEAQKKYVRALEELLKTQKEVQDEQSNPFNLGLPTHLGLSNETFITDEQLSKLTKIIGQSIDDNKQFAKLWNIGTDIILKAKAIFL